MSKWGKRIFWGILSIIFLAIAMMHFGMRMMRYSNADVEKFIVENEIEGSVEYLSTSAGKIRMVVEKQSEEDSILFVFVHGAPGSWDAFKSFLADEELLSRGQLISYDRPGYGGSTSTAIGSITTQANVLNEIIERYRLPHVVLVGHSYGCAIAGKSAADLGEQVDDIFLIGSLIDPESEPIFWFSYFSYWDWSKWILPKDLQIAGVEKFAHANSLEHIKNDWKKIKADVYFIHGMKDGIAPPEPNIHFAQKNIPADVFHLIKYEDEGHIVLWEEFEMIRDVILERILF